MRVRALINIIAPLALFLGMVTLIIAIVLGTFYFATLYSNP